jgi:hypothetical protein
MYIFIAIIFIAELIIALSLINLMVKADKKVQDLNECVKAFNPLAQTCMQYTRCMSSEICGKVKSGINFITKQHKKMIIKAISTVAIYSMLLFFKIKRVRAKKLYNLVDAIRDIVLELAV